ELTEVAVPVILANGHQIDLLGRGARRISVAQRRGGRRLRPPGGQNTRRSHAKEPTAVLHAANVLVCPAQDELEWQRIRARELEVGSIREVLMTRPCPVGKNLSDFRRID